MKKEELGQQLSQAFADVPDPRSKHGQRHPLPAILVLAALAMLDGARSLYVIASWGRLQSPEVVHALGFTREKTPSTSTLHEVFKALDVAAFEAVLRAWTREELGEQEKEIASLAMQLRGIHGESIPGVEWLVAYQAKTGLVLE